MIRHFEPTLTFAVFVCLAACDGKTVVDDETAQDGGEGVGGADSTPADDDTDDDLTDDDAPDVGSPDDDVADDQLILEPEPLTDAGPAPDVVVQFDGGDGGVAACGGDVVRSSRKEVTLLLVIDKSSSMLDTDGDENDVDRWTKLSQATAATLDGVQNEMWLGLEVFPRREGDPIPADCDADGSCCAMPDGDAAILVPPGEGSTAAPAIIDALSTITPSGGTPTARALELAFDYFTSGAGQDAPGDRYVLLVTDGGPTCGVEPMCDAETCTTNIQELCPPGVENCCDATFPGGPDRCLDVDAPLQAIEALRNAGIETAVMGIPGTEFYAEQMNVYALAGGIPNTEGATDYFAVSAEGGVAELEAALATVTTQLVQTCVLELGEAPPDEDRVNVRIDGELVPKEGDDGWDLDLSADPPTLTLKGATCAQIETEGVDAITVLFGCPTLYVPPRAR